MREQTERTDVDEAHRAASRVKLERLQQQRLDLGSCLDALLADAMAGRAYFKVYRQFKMYNDPRFNPALVAERQGTAGRVRLLIVKTTSMGDVVHACRRQATCCARCRRAGRLAGRAALCRHPGSCTRVCSACCPGLAQVAQAAAAAAPPGRPWAALRPSCARSPTTWSWTCRAC
jgi:hypothetical protein